MIDLEILTGLCEETSSKIVLLVLDGLGGLPQPETGLTELETAFTPNMDRIASDGVCGLADPVSPGITPGSGPGHLSLFGYDPVKYQVGRGVLEALGMDFHLAPGDVAARCNFCTIDENGKVEDRRAGRIPSEKNAELCEKLRDINIDGVELFILPGKEHRFATIFRGEGLGGEVNDTDPQKVGAEPKTAVSNTTEGKRLADAVNEFVAQARRILADLRPANMVLFRGISQRPDLPLFGDVFKLKPAAIATYPMYSGLARLVGMEILNTGTTFEDELRTLADNWKNHNFFFIHVKHTDSAGEDGDFEKKVSVIEAVDTELSELTRLKPDVLVITGDHSTPAALKSHSWHPVPVLLNSRYCRSDEAIEFSERGCLTGGLGRIAAADIMPLAMANALKLSKFGA
ncbi:MAG: 2,3-bisphosphoglycerate-independent phosphoglycerate mutase [Dehalococcoidia bacterium]